MAINTTNSNYVNISNLPSSQQAIGSDLLILQTENGTSTISFDDFNVVKTDAAGNATVVGNLTGNSAVFSTISASGDVRTLNYYANNVKGIYAPHAYYNRLTLNSGLVTSANYVIGSPEYFNITQTFIPALTTWQNGLYKKIFDTNGSVTVDATTLYKVVTITSFYQNNPSIASDGLKVYHFSLMPAATLNTVPYVSNINTDRTSTNDLTFRVNLGATETTNKIISWRILYTYT